MAIPRCIQELVSKQYCNRSHNGKTYMDLYNDINDLVKYHSVGVKSSTMQRSKTATDHLGAHAQAAGATILTAPVGKHRSSKQHPYAKHNNSQSTHQPTAISTTSHPILVVDRRAT